MKTAIINTTTKKIFYIFHLFVSSKLEQNPHYQLLSDYNKIKEEENKIKKDTQKKSLIKEDKPKRKYKKKEIKKD